MLRKQNCLDPIKINNYNKFLLTLDKTINNPIENIINNTNKPKETDISCKYTNQNENENENANENQNKNILKKEIDEMIERINNNFKFNIEYTQFSDQPEFNKKINKHYINNDNDYKDITLDTNSIYQKRYSENIIKEHVNIETEINNINDILSLIEKYKIDPSIEYNINMELIHNIKEPLEELNNMIGMKELKNSIVEQILYFIQDLHKNSCKTGDFMHTVIYGHPGTGKTEIAKIMGKIYSKIGILNKGTFKKVTRSDLIAGYLGQTALKTRDVIKESIGGVLFIDEAYALGNNEKRDSFSKECIDTLCEALSDHKDELMVIIAGYEEELKECFFNYNKGLDSRFSWRFKTDEYSGEDLYKIFLKKVKDIGWEISVNDENAIITKEWFIKNKEYFKFFGRDIETLLVKTKITHSKRVFCKPVSEKKKINLKDLEKGFANYLNNDEIKNRKKDEYFKKQLYSTLYS